MQVFSVPLSLASAGDVNGDGFDDRSMTAGSNAKVIDGDAERAILAIH